jgi:hypothetical protein
MIDIQQIFADMGKAIQSSDFPSAPLLALTLGLDLSKATVTSTEAGVVSIADAFLAPSEEKVGVIAARTARRTLDLVFLAPTLSVQPYIEGRLGADQHVEPSKHGPGLAIAFTVDGLGCGVTASGREGVIETLYCVA